MEVIAIIAQLCLVHPTLQGYSRVDVDEYQLACQQYYVKCVMDDHYTFRHCIMSRKAGVNASPKK